MACELLTTQEAACESAIGKIDNPIVLLQIIAQLACELADSGGGGGSANLSGSGSPVGVVTPDAENQFYTDRNNVPLPTLWQSTGLTSSDWIQLI